MKEASAGVDAGGVPGRFPHGSHGRRAQECFNVGCGPELREM